jgi:hypothetical protein
MILISSWLEAFARNDKFNHSPCHYLVFIARFNNEYKTFTLNIFRVISTRIWHQTIMQKIQRTKTFQSLFINISTWLLLFTYSNLHAQSLEKDLLQHYKMNINSNGSFNKTPNSTVYLLSNNVHLNYAKEKLEYNLYGRWNYGANSIKLTNNDFSTSFDCNLYLDTPKKFNGWVIASFISSYSLNIRNEYQIGTGIAYKVLDTVGGKSFFLKLSDGLIWEYSDFTLPDNDRGLYYVVRNSFRFQFRVYSIDRRISLETTTFWQQALNKAHDFNWRSTARFEYKIWEAFTINTQLEYNYITRTERDNLIITYGIGFKWPQKRK